MVTAPMSSASPVSATAIGGSSLGVGSARADELVVEVEDLVKVYGRDVRAVDGISFGVERGGFFGFLGPNGAGKTTTLRILSTLLTPTSGTARLLGMDVVRDADRVRRRIGFAMQQVALEGLATGRENLELIGRLHRMSREDIRARADELLDLMGLGHVADRLVGTYSGGMKRRLDLATAMMHRPDVLFLDEPTEGLDPQSRAALWAELERINRTGTTMFLTTHYMEEADKLCRRLAIIDEGVIVVEGTPVELKRSIGADHISLSLAPDDEAATGDRRAIVAAQLQAVDGITAVDQTAEGIELSVHEAQSALPRLVRLLDANGVRIGGLSMREPSLDDVFLRYTGKRIRPEAADAPLTMWD
jgi:ABC-2 type transport system ATP-binding protein